MSKDSAQTSAASGVLLGAILHAGDQKGDKLIADVAERLKSQGYRVGGVIQSNIMQPGQCRCDMVLEELTSGQVIPISQNLGKESRGCRLDSGALERVVGLVEASVRGGIDILVLNKFGNQEIEGKGLRNAIALAVEANIPVLVGLNRANVEVWNDFCGGEGQLLEADMIEVGNWLYAYLPPARRGGRETTDRPDISV